jgi:hypothetical protein
MSADTLLARLDKVKATETGRWQLAFRLARQIPNHPHPDRAEAVHRWALAVQQALRGGAARHKEESCVL